MVGVRLAIENCPEDGILGAALTTVNKVLRHFAGGRRARGLWLV
jgi:hypothetical protein